MSARWILPIALGLLQHTPAALASDPSNSAGVVWKEFLSRQQAVETANVVWSMRFYLSVTARENMHERRPRFSTVVGQKPLDLPPTERRLLVSGTNACRYENIGLLFTQEDDGLPYRSIICYGEDGTYQSFSERAGSVERHTGRIDHRDAPPVWDALHIKPLILALRPLRPEAFGADPSTWDIRSEPAVVDGRACLVLRGYPPAFGSGGPVYELSLDRSRGYIPLRYVSRDRASGRIYSQVDMRYERTEEPTWMPSWWKVDTFFGDGTISEASENEKVQVTLGMTLPTDTFQINYPPGTLVRDGRKGEQHFIIADDGRYVPRREAEARASSNGASWPWLIAAFGAAALGIGLLVWRRAAAG